jgi:hypothetical protein
MSNGEGGTSIVEVCITDSNGVPSSATLRLQGMSTEQRKAVAHIPHMANELMAAIKKVVHGDGKSH